MRIRELRAEARNALKGNLMKVALPITGILIFNFLLGLGFEFLVEEVFDFDIALTMIVSLIFYVAVIAFYSILQFGIIKRVIKVSRNEESNFFADTFSGESVKASFSILWGFIKKYAIWVILMILPLISSAIFMVGAYEFTELNTISSINSVDTMQPQVGQIVQIEKISTTVMEVLTWVASIFSIIAIVAICVISYRYMLVYYLKHDYPDKPTKELFKNSRMMMKGNKAKALVVPVTMIAWFFVLMIVVVILSVILEIIWPSKVYYFTTVSTVPVWANILFNCLIYFLTSLLTSYINMTYYQLYMEQKPLEIYNDDYLKPETNAKKYIWIVAGVVVSVVLIYFFICYLYMQLILSGAYNM